MRPEQSHLEEELQCIKAGVEFRADGRPLPRAEWPRLQGEEHTWYVVGEMELGQRWDPASGGAKNQMTQFDNRSQITLIHVFFIKSKRLKAQNNHIHAQIWDHGEP